MIQNLQMIPRNDAYWQDNEWKKLFSGALSCPLELLKRLDLSLDALPFAIDSSPKFVQRVPEPFIERMKKENPYDPLLLQVLALSVENQEITGFVGDPLQEQESVVPGLLHKYPSRALVMLATSCAINCRYCFRREFPYADNNPSKSGWPAMLEYLQSQPQINEVILSGGDPLAVNDKYLADFITQIETIAHIKRLRIHTRLPIVIPQRINTPLLKTLENTRFQCVMVVHVNHPNELDEDVNLAMQRLKNHGISLLNQTVLLKGINDDAQILAELSEKLFAFGIIPYYLHLLDKVKGSAHFDLSREQAIKITNQLQTKLSGFLVPKLALEEPNKLHKTLLPLSQ